MSTEIDVHYNSRIDSPQKDLAQSLGPILTFSKCIKVNIFERDHGDQGTNFARGSGDSMTAAAISRWEYLSRELKYHSSVFSLRQQLSMHGSVDTIKVKPWGPKGKLVPSLRANG